MFTPENIKKLTNVSIITYKSHGKTFELALFPNKYYEYKRGLETNLEFILQTTVIFKDCSRGSLAAKADIQLVFQSLDKDEILRHILDNGVERSNERTRNFELEQLHKEIATIVCKKVLCDLKLLSLDACKTLITQHGFKLRLNKEAKIQANEVVKLLLLNKRYTQRKMKISLIDKKETIEMTGDEYIIFKVEAEKAGMKYEVNNDTEIDDEEIC